MLSDGGFVIVWEDQYYDDEGWGVFGLQFDADGTKSGSQFKVNGYTESYQMDPDVAALSDGGFVVVWYALEDTKELLDQVAARRFDASGATQGWDISLATTYSYKQQNPAVTGLSAGGFAAVWDGYGSGDADGVHMRIYDSAGSPLEDQSLVNNYTLEEQNSPDIDQLASGDLVVVWVSKDQDGNGRGVFLRRFTDSGTPIGSDVQVNTFFVSDQIGPRVVASDTGDFLVTWYDEGPDDPEGIMARRFDSAGVALGEQFTVNSTIPQTQYFQCAAALPGGPFVAAWQSEHQDGEKWGVYLRRFDGSDSPLASDSVVNIYTALDQQLPDCAAFTDGTFVVTWQSMSQDGSGLGIFHQRFASEGYRLYP